MNITITIQSSGRLSNWIHKSDWIQIPSGYKAQTSVEMNAEQK